MLEQADKPSLPSFSVSKRMEDGSELAVMCSSFQDRDFVMVTQVGKLGTLLDVNVDIPKHSAAVTYDVRTLMGADDDLMHAFGRTIGQFVYESRCKMHSAGDASRRVAAKPLLCSVAVKKIDRELLMLVLDLLKPCAIWSA